MYVSLSMLSSRIKVKISIPFSFSRFCISTLFSNILGIYLSIYLFKNYPKTYTDLCCYVYTIINYLFILYMYSFKWMYIISQLNCSLKFPESYS